MNRREAIAALTALPAITRISKADLAPTDVLVVECDQHISVETGQRIKALMADIWPGHKVAVFSKGMTLKVVSKLNA